MSTVQGRLKSVPKRRNKSNDRKQNYKEPVNSKKDRNLTIKGVKRRLSNEEEVPNKRISKSQNVGAGPSSNISSSVLPDVNKSKALGSLRNESSNVSKAIEPKHLEPSKNLAKNRLSQLRKNLKDSQPSLKSENKDLLKRTSHTSKEDATKMVKNETKPSFKSNFKIPVKKSVNERLNLVKDNLQDQKLEKNPSGIPRSPGKTRYNLKRSYDNANRNLCTSPVEKVCCLENTSGQKIKLDRTKAETSYSKSPETSSRFSSNFIVISEASDSESSTNNLTPINQRLISIKNRRSSNSSDKTVTPGSPNTVLKEECFKTPLRPPNVADGLKVPFNRNLFKRRTETGVQTDTNIFRTKDERSEEPVKVPAGPSSTNIFGAQVVQPNIFQSYGNSPEKSNNIFTSNSPSHKNIVNQTTTETTVRSNIFGATICQENSFSGFTSKTESSTAKTGTRFPETSFNALKDTNQSKHSTEPLIAEVRTGHQIFSQKVTQSSRKSATDRLARIKNEGCNYRKTEAIVRAEKGDENRECRQVMEHSVENPLGPDSPSKRQPTIKEFLTENWLTSHQGPSNVFDDTMSDSLVVNVDETIFNKSELPDPIEDVSMDWDVIPQAIDILQPTAPTPTEPEKENIICIVTDTNVFMHFLPKVKDIVNLKTSGPQMVKIFVPWMVLKELDHLKDHSGEPTKSTALDAERFINRCLEGPDSKIIVQSVHEVSQQEDIGKDPDDKILSCCMQAVKKFKTVILLTNDINLRNKAIACEMETCPPRDVSSRLNLMMSKFCKIRSKLVLLWSRIICDCCKQAFGDAWTKMDMLQNPPWSMSECIKRFKKYWGSVFRDVLLKQCLKSLDGVHNFLMKHKGHILDDSDDFNNFLKLVLDFLLFLQDLSEHKDFIKQTIKEITDIADGR